LTSKELSSEVVQIFGRKRVFSFLQDGGRFKKRLRRNGWKKSQKVDGGKFNVKKLGQPTLYGNRTNPGKA